MAAGSVRRRAASIQMRQPEPFESPEDKMHAVLVLHSFMSKDIRFKQCRLDFGRARTPFRAERVMCLPAASEVPA